MKLKAVHICIIFHGDWHFFFLWSVVTIVENYDFMIKRLPSRARPFCCAMSFHPGHCDVMTAPTIRVCCVYRRGNTSSMFSPSISMSLFLFCSSSSVKVGLKSYGDGPDSIILISRFCYSREKYVEGESKNESLLLFLAAARWSRRTVRHPSTVSIMYANRCVWVRYYCRPLLPHTAGGLLNWGAVGTS